MATPVAPTVFGPATIHPTAIVGPDVELSDGVVIGPYAVLSGRIRIGLGTHVFAHTVIDGSTTIGAHCRLGPSAAVGVPPQAKAYDGCESHLTVGDHVTVREFATVNRAAKPGVENATVVGDGCFMMTCSHVGHDCRVGRNVTMANCVLLAGHVVVGDGATFGGAAAVHQFCRVGRLAMVGAGVTALKDVLPFGVVTKGGSRAYNAIGVKRSGMPAESVRSLRQAFATLNQFQTYPQGAAALRASGETLAPEALEVIEFIETSKRGIVPKERKFAGGRGDDD